MKATLKSGIPQSEGRLKNAEKDLYKDYSGKQTYSKGQNEKSTIGATSTNFATLSGVGADRSSSVSNAGQRPR